MSSSGLIIQTASRTRSIFLASGEFIRQAGTPVRLELATDAGGVIPCDVWAFDPTTAESIVGFFRLPKDCISGNITAKLLWLVLTTSTNPVAWRLGGRLVASGVGINLDLTSIVSAAAPGVIRQIVETTITTDLFPSTTELADKMSNIYIERVTGDAGDTFANDAYFLGLSLEYLADS